MRRCRTLGVAALGAALSLAALGAAPTPAHADPPVSDASAAGGSDVLARAEDHFRTGNLLYGAGAWAQAEVELLAAWALKRTYDVAANLGHTEFQLGKYRDAAEHLAFAVQSWPPTGKREPFVLAQKRLAEARGHIATLTIRVSPAGAAVAIDGKRSAPLTAEYFVEAGAHTIEASLDGYVTQTESIAAPRGASRTVTIDLQRERGPSPVLLVGGAILTVGGVAAGIALTVASNGEGADADDQVAALVAMRGPQPCLGVFADDTACREVGRSLSSRDTLGTGAVIAFAGAGAAAVGTAAYGLLTRRRSSAALAASATSATSATSAGLRVAPVIAAGQRGVVVTGTW